MSSSINPGAFPVCFFYLLPIPKKHRIRTGIPPAYHPHLRTYSIIMMMTKHSLRRQMASALREIGPVEIQNQSQCIANNICKMSIFRKATAICVYLNMPQSEATTDAILEYAFEAKKTVYVPKIIGKNAKDMVMVKVVSFQDIATFPKVVCDSGITLHHTRYCTS